MTSDSLSTPNALRIGVLWRGEPAQPAPPREGTRLAAIFRELSSQGAQAEPVVFADEIADQVRTRLLGLDGVLVWVDPIMDGVNRLVLDGLLRDVASHGIYVSAHPDVVLKMGTKDVLYRTRGLSWGTDVRRYATPTELLQRLPAALDSGPRVLKQMRGNGGNGVWRIEWARRGDDSSTAELFLLHGVRGSTVERATMDELERRLRPYFGEGNAMIDQAFQPRLVEGMVRCYMAQDRVAGFGQQMVTALLAGREVGADSPSPPARVYCGPDASQFQGVRNRMESEWLPALLEVLELDAGELPAIWDADLLYGEGSATGAEAYILCEINVSSVFPLPGEAVKPLTRAALRCAAAARRARGG